MIISVTSKIDDVLKGLSELEKDAVPNAAQQALNRAGRTVQSRTVKELATEMALRKQSDIRALITITKAAKGSLSVKVTVMDKALGVEASKKLLVKQNFKGKGSSKRRVFKVNYKGEVIDQAFRVQNLGGMSGKGIFTPLPDQPRYKTGNRQISRVFSFTTVQELIHAKLDEMQEKIGTERFEVEFDTALANALRRLRL
ncbi:MAG: Prophage minor tail protein [Akkermansiaceae bacterium]|nr:Prophage minor tail protein [Akkermansiaceae bacterium]